MKPWHTSLSGSNTLAKYAIFPLHNKLSGFKWYFYVTIVLIGFNGDTWVRLTTNGK